MLAIAFLFKKKLQNYQLCHGLFQSVCDGRNRIVLMRHPGTGMGVAAAASELKKNRLKRTEKRRSGWCSVQTSEPQI